MARFMVERTFPDGLEIPITSKGVEACLSVIGTNAKSCGRSITCGRVARSARGCPVARTSAPGARPGTSLRG